MKGDTYLTGPFQLARLDLDKCRVDIETVERGDDVPDQGYVLAVCSSGAVDEGDGARFVLRAVNSYHDMLAALQAYVAELEEQCVALGWKSVEQYREYHSDRDSYDLARAAIAKATAPDKDENAAFNEAVDVEVNTLLRDQDFSCRRLRSECQAMARAKCSMPSRRPNHDGQQNE